MGPQLLYQILIKWQHLGYVGQALGILGKKDRVKNKTYPEYLGVLPLSFLLSCPFLSHLLTGLAHPGQYLKLLLWQ